MREVNFFKWTSIALSWTWLALFALIPIVLVIVISFLSHNATDLYTQPFTTQNYAGLLNPLYLPIFFRSLVLALLATVLCLVISYPFAYFISTSHPRHKSLLLIMVIIPFWTSSLIRTYAIMAILKAKGLLNSLLLALGLIHQPLQILYSNTALIIGLVYTLIPFMILPLYSTMEKLDHTLIDAARDLGAKRARILFKVLIPMTRPGILSGSILVFLPAMTLFYLPALLGGSKSMTLGNLIQNQFLVATNWPMGAALSTALMLFILVVMLFFWRHTRKSERRDLGRDLT